MQTKIRQMSSVNYKKPFDLFEAASNLICFFETWRYAKKYKQMFMLTQVFKCISTGMQWLRSKHTSLSCVLLCAGHEEDDVSLSESEVFKIKKSSHSKKVARRIKEQTKKEREKVRPSDDVKATPKSEPLARPSSPAALDSPPDEYSESRLKVRPMFEFGIWL